VDPRLNQTTRPTCPESALSPETRDVLDRHNDSTEAVVQYWIKKGLAEDQMDRVEVREILDCKNPVKLFALPGEKVHGVFAKRDFEELDWVLFYGGTLVDDGPEKGAVDDSYMMDATMETYPDMIMIVNGQSSVAGQLNDPIGLGTLHREANVGTIMEFDIEAKNPLVIVHAEKKIGKGDEILLEYGKEYWHTAVKTMIKAQHKFIGNTFNRLKALSMKDPENNKMRKT
jgi:hypothetical protein